MGTPFIMATLTAKSHLKWVELTIRKVVKCDFAVKADLAPRERLELDSRSRYESAQRINARK